MKLFLGFLLLITAAYPPVLQAGEMVDTSTRRLDRERMVSTQIHSRGISSQRVLDAMAKVPRHLFVPEQLASKAYSDHPLPIGEGQTISQPYIVALMTDSLNLNGRENVLEVGTGSGYQAAVLAELVSRVTTVEIKQPLHKKATRLLEDLGYENIATVFGDGYYGHPPTAPYDCIMITAAVDHIPPPLIRQLKTGGRLILPLGNPFSYQNLALIHKKEDQIFVKQITGVLFVPMTGHALDR